MAGVVDAISPRMLLGATQAIGFDEAGHNE